jgi:His/Glu/Gln/Arg/opine family amino acid ABC transporter permease subunit
MPDVVLRNLPFLLGGLGNTVAIALITALAGTALAVPIALLRHGRVPVLSSVCAAYVGVIQGTPLLIVLLFCYVAMPALFGYRTTGFAACTLGFTLFLAAYCAEDMRAGLLSVPAALPEAADALGLTRLQRLRLIVLPLAARAAAPPIIGQYVRMVKYTSVASVIGVPEITGRALMVNARIFQPLPILAITAAAYFAICLSLSMSARALDARSLRKRGAGA